MKGGQRMHGADFMLVVMPWAMTNQPSLQAGLLTALLEREGISARSLYANLNFAAKLGWDRYNAFCSFHNQGADWIFSEAVFGQFTPPPDRGAVTFELFAANNGLSDGDLRELADMKSQVQPWLEECLWVVPWEDVRVAGFTTTMLQPLAALAFAKALKSRYPHITILLGGAGCQGPMGRAMHGNFPFLDGVVDGEADRTISPLVRMLLADEDPTSISGLWWRDRTGRVTFTPPEPVMDLSAYPVPQYRDYFEQSRALANPGLTSVRIPFEASRGCWWGMRRHCAFCGLNGAVMTQRDRPAAAVAEELQVQNDLYAPTLFVAADNIISQRHVRELPKMLEAQPAKPPLFFEIGAAISRQRLASLHRAGITEMQPGIESLSTNVLKLVGKGTSAIGNLAFLRRTRELGINTYWNFLYGLPGEQLEWYEAVLEWLPLVYHLTAPEPVRFSLQRFSPFFDDPDRHGITVLGPMPAARYIWNLPEDQLCNIGYELDFRTESTNDTDAIGELLTSAAHQWLNSGALLELTPRRDGSAIIVDRRGSRGTERRLSLPEAATLSAIEAPSSEDELIQRLRRARPDVYVQAGGRTGVVQALRRLTRAGLVILLDGKYLALPLPTADFWIDQRGRSA